MTLPRMSDTLGRRHKGPAALKEPLLLAYAVLFLLIFLPPAKSSIFVWMTLGLTALALWFGPLDLLTSDKERKWYDPAMLFNLAIFYYALKGVTLAGGVKPEYLLFLPNDMIATGYVTVALFVMGGLIAWNWGYYTVLRRRIPNGLAKRIFPENKSKSASLVGNPLLGVILLSLIGIACLLLFSRSIGGDIFIFLLHPLQLSYLADDTFGAASPLANLWKSGVDMFPVASLIWLAIIGQMKKKPGILWWIHVSISIGINLVMGGRADVLGLIASIALVYHLSVSPLSATFIAGFAGVAAAYAYLINQWRSVVGGMSSASIAVGQSEVINRLSLDGLYAFLSGTDLTDIRLFVLIADAYDRVRPFQYGATLLRVVSQFVPRAVWPGKPLDLSIEIADLFRPGSLSGIPPGFFAEMYLNWHVFGVILGGALLGAGLALLYRNWIVTKSSAGTVFYAILLPRILMLPSGTLANVIDSAIVSFLGAMIAFAVSRLFAQSNRVTREVVAAHG
ncbi:MAG: hypothetical protein NT169_20900 [Chloroflexi bacterium]|nr:hypothetical protein [Chloroflexota bacterium]